MVEKAIGQHHIEHRMRRAMASGLPPKVEPCVPAVMPLPAAAVARQAPSGKPPPSAFASVMMSGTAPVR